MSLYTSIQRFVNTRSLHNDVLLHVFGYVTWQELVDRNRLDAASATELQTSIEYWSDLYDLETTEQGQYVIRLRMSEALSGAFTGCDRDVIDEAQFLAIIGYTTEIATKQGKMTP